MSLTIAEIVELSKKMERETKAIKDEMFRVCWYMRGALSITEAYELTVDDRQILAKIISDNLETAKKTGMPFF